VETGAPVAGVTQPWAREHLASVGAAWHKNHNAGDAIDLWLLNQLPHRTLPQGWIASGGLVLPERMPLQLPPLATPAFSFSGGGYQTINFLPSLATMLFGLMCGELLRSSRPARRKLAILVAAGLGGLAVGQGLDLTGVCPLVKRLWTPSWALFSTGWCCLILAALYGVVDVLGWRWWTYPLVVVGVNSIAIYCMSMLLPPWTARTLQIHFGREVFLGWGTLWEPTLRALLVGLCFWLACWWMYRQKLFIRI
jgi:predicted acyltransferase